MDPVSALERLGGTADSMALLDLTSRRRLRSALAAGTVVRSHRGRYTLPDVDRAQLAAARANGVLALRSAALHHGWPVKFPPRIPEVAVPRKRNVRAHKGIRLVWLSDLDTSLPATPPLQTVLGARMLPFDEALPIADSALRAGDLTGPRSRSCRRPTRGQARHRTSSKPTPGSGTPASGRT